MPPEHADTLPDHSSSRLTNQQRMVLDAASRLSYISARMLNGTLKPDRPLYGGRRAMTTGSAQAVMRRLSRRGLLAQDDRNPAIFRITDKGREAINA